MSINESGFEKPILSLPITKPKYKLAVFIGRFQPIHEGHISIINDALRIAEKVIILIGSSNQSRTIKNPFTFAERKDMIDYVYFSESRRIICEPLEDNLYNDQAWTVDVQNIVYKHAPIDAKESDIVLVGHEKDETSYYIRMFPQWKLHTSKLTTVLHSSEIRNIYFSNNPNLNYLVNVVPQSVIGFMNCFKDRQEYKLLVEEKQFIDKYKEQYSSLRYKPIFTTVDAVVIQSGNVLMVKRRSFPGKGLYAFPGGFVDAEKDRSLEDAMIRELKEETCIDLPDKVLRGNIKGMRVFDALGRSLRGRTITHAYNIVLPQGEWNLPKIKGSDDAESAHWIPIASLKQELCYEDHYQILRAFLGN